MRNSNGFAMDEQEFAKALQEAVDRRDVCEANRLVQEHMEATEAFLERALAQLEMHLNNSTVH